MQNKDEYTTAKIGQLFLRCYNLVPQSDKGWVLYIEKENKYGEKETILESFHNENVLEEK